MRDLRSNGKTASGWRLSGLIGQLLHWSLAENGGTSSQRALLTTAPECFLMAHSETSLEPSTPQTPPLDSSGRTIVLRTGTQPSALTLTGFQVLIPVLSVRRQTLHQLSLHSSAAPSRVPSPRVFRPGSRATSVRPPCRDSRTQGGYPDRV